MRTKAEIASRLASLESSSDDKDIMRAEVLRWVLKPKNAKSTPRILEGTQLDLVDSTKKKKVYYKD
jgi:hypothetical protein